MESRTTIVLTLDGTEFGVFNRHVYRHGGRVRDDVADGPVARAALSVGAVTDRCGVHRDRDNVAVLGNTGRHMMPAKRKRVRESPE
ncbi:hypothetical protein DPMN_042962 [Dreissena polymorpha]|uniref:Uncharacterized protein n=1 Tax=Dreissena polymorpha TaxID=45954 RepID=A0A9D4D1Y9_DREPO|nr:hypothetical protein DPMN_042962 [Dreissena polymorpha]